MRSVGTVAANGAKRKKPAWRSSSEPKMLGASNAGTQSHSMEPSGATSAPVWQSERNAKSAMGGKGDGAAALCSGCRPSPASSRLPFGFAACARGVTSGGGRELRGGGVAGLAQLPARVDGDRAAQEEADAGEDRDGTQAEIGED